MTRTHRAAMLVAVAAAAFAGGCRKETPSATPGASLAPMAAAGVQANAPESLPAPGATPDAPIARYLPDRAPPFVASPLVAGPGFVRRDYTHDAVHIDVTLAEQPMSPDRYADWQRQSHAYPSVLLDVPPDSASGFYECGGSGKAERCNLHVQLRNGVHVEIMGGGTASRADLDALVRRLPLRSLAAGAPSILAP